MKDSDNIFAAVRESRRFAALVSGAAEKGQLKKCSFSMPLDRSVKKAQASACIIGGRRMIQLELFLVDGKADTAQYSGVGRRSPGGVCTRIFAGKAHYHVGEL